jgi:hypothetical protein
MHKCIIEEAPNSKEYLVGLINQICELAYHSYQIDIPAEVRLNVIVEVLEHYGNHISVYNVSMNGIDPYKVLAWAGIRLYKLILEFNREMAEEVLACTFVALERTLKSEGKTVPQRFIQKLFKMTIAEYSNKSDIGIGANGLYVAFRMASLSEYIMEDL